MEIRNRVKEWFDSIEGEENRRQHLRAFRDFCLDLLEEEYSRMAPEEEIGPQFVKLAAQRARLPGHAVASRMRAKEISFILCPLTPPTRRGLQGTCRSKAS